MLHSPFISFDMSGNDNFFWRNKEALIKKRMTSSRTPPWSSNLKFMRNEELLGGERIKLRDHGGSEESGYCCGLLIKA